MGRTMAIDTIFPDGATARVGDQVRFTDPATGLTYENLEVDEVLEKRRKVRLTGTFRGKRLKERTVPFDQVVVTHRASLEIERPSK